MAKTTIITLIVPEHGLEQDFEIEHAERLLSMKNNGGWQIKDKSKFEFSLENGITSRGNKEKN